MLDWLTDDLAVGGRFPVERAEHLADALGVRAVVDMRAECCDDMNILSAAGLRFLHLPTPDHHASSPQMLDQGVEFARSHLARNERVLIHCEHGIGRSALLALCVLVDGGMEPIEALRLAKHRRGVISPSPAQYEGWSAWLARRGRRPPDFGTFAAIAYAQPARG